MEYEFVGQRTGKVYAIGHKNDCFRQLLKEFPSQHDRFETGTGRPRDVQAVYPEVILIRPVRKVTLIEGR